MDENKNASARRLVATSYTPKVAYGSIQRTPDTASVYRRPGKFGDERRH